MSQDYINEETTFVSHNPLSTGGHYIDDNNSKIDNNKQPSTLDLDSILKSFFQPGHGTTSQQDQTVATSNPSSRRHSVAVGELDLQGMMDPTWFDQPAYPVDDLNFSSALSHLHQYSQLEQQQYHPNHHNHHYHRRAMSMQQSDGFLSQAHLHSLSNQHHQTNTNNTTFDRNKDTLAEFHPPSSFVTSSSDFTNNMIMNMDLFNPPNDVVPTWLLSNTTPSTTNDSSCSSSSPPPSAFTTGNESNCKVEDEDIKQPKKKRQKSTHSATTIDTVPMVLDPTCTLKQESSPTSALNQLPLQPHCDSLLPRTPADMTPDAIRSFVQRYLAERYGERTVMLLTSRVAQKSYGTEKRFLCPPPTTILSGSWCIQLPSSSPASPTTTTTMQPRLMIQISGETTQQAGTLEWSTLPPPVLPSTFTTFDGGFLHSSSTVGKCISKHLHINDADEKRKRVQVMVNIQLANNENIGTFSSKGIKVISKPSKKRQSLKNIDLCIHHGTTISLFNRIRSQTVSTKYLGVSSQPSSTTPSSSSPAAANNTSTASNCCFVARTNVWDPFVIWIVDPQRTQQPRTPSSDNSSNINTNTHYPPPPAMALHHTGKEQLAVHYNQPVVLQCLTTGLVSPVMTIRKVDKGSSAQSGAMVMEPTSSTVSEALGDPVSQLHKVAFQIQPPSVPVQTPTTPSSPAPSHPYQVPPTQPPVDQQQQQQHQRRNIFLACLNDVVGRHKCLNPPRRISSTLPGKTASSKQQKGPTEPSNGRRRSSASSSLDQIDLSQGAFYEQDVSDAAVWTIVGTDCVRYTFAAPPPTSVSLDSSYMRPDIAPFPVVSSVSQGESTLCLWGESLTSQLTVYVGDQALATEFKSPEALVCVIPPAPGGVAAAGKKQPILLVRKDGVIYKTNHTFCLDP